MSGRRSVRSCEARQQIDEMHCAPCGLTWDINDPDPPPCGGYTPASTPKLDERLQAARHALELAEFRGKISTMAAELQAEAGRIFNAGREYERALHTNDKE